MSKKWGCGMMRWHRLAKFILESGFPGRGIPYSKWWEAWWDLGVHQGRLSRKLGRQSLRHQQLWILTDYSSQRAYGTVSSEADSQKFSIPFMMLLSTWSDSRGFPGPRVWFEYPIVFVQWCNCSLEAWLNGTE